MAETPYSRAWQNFSMTNEFVKLCDPQTVSSDRKYLINRLREAFDAGWNAKTSLIFDAISQMADVSEGREK